MKAHPCLSVCAALLSTAIALLASSVLGSTTAHAASSDQCSMRLTIELTPDVPNPQDPAFLSSLLSNHVAYALKPVRPEGAAAIVADLSGPGPDEQCREVMEAMGHDGRIVSIRPESEEVPSISVTGSRESENIHPDVHASRTGFGSLYWAAQHPTEAWRIVLPVSPHHFERVYADAVQACTVLPQGIDVSPNGIDTSSACP